MTEAWFLDLDGVKSGPYQTREIFSLIAEGEILPHHRISIGLKNESWSSILDWRFEQAKKTPHAEKQSEEVSEISEPIESQPTSFIESSPIIEPETITTPPSSPPQLEKKLPKIEIETVREEEESTPLPQGSLNDSGFNKKRDPTAEMFDILQNSRLKREAKSQQQTLAQSNSDRIQHTQTTQKRNTIFALISIVILGYGLGQYFQPTETPQAQAPVTPTVPPPPSSASINKPETKNEEPSTQIVDRSNDKMVIRSKVDKSLSNSAPPNEESEAENETKATESDMGKDLQDLKDLKKELQELKALKDELKGNSRNSSRLSTEDYESSNGSDYSLEDEELSGFNDYSGTPPPSTSRRNQPLNNPNIR